ncbi:hypothetical protein TNCV_1505121 [Trichonephila clavipes]|nr:hypothetical protein TNCV_1505121 [Trichonephila clavipes]
MLDTCTPLSISSADTVIAERYKDDILEPYARVFRGAVEDQFILMDANARPHKVALDIWRRVRHIEVFRLNPGEHLWDVVCINSHYMSTALSKYLSRVRNGSFGRMEITASIIDQQPHSQNESICYACIACTLYTSWSHLLLNKQC